MLQVSSLKALPASLLQMEFSSKTNWTQCTACPTLCCCAVAVALFVAPGLQVKILAIGIETRFAQRGETITDEAISLFVVNLCGLHASWVNVGPIKGGSTEYCHAGSQCSLLGITVIHGKYHYAAMHVWRYFGPCADELQSFADMSAMAIKRWSRGCQVEWAPWGCTVGIWHIAHVYQAYFPCRSKFCFREQLRSVQFSVLPGCRRDYQNICPDGWARLGNEQKCKPPEDYTGRCRWHGFCDTLHLRLRKEACKGNSQFRRPQHRHA